MKNLSKQITCTLVFCALTLTAKAQSSGAFSESSDFMNPPSSLMVSIMSGEMVEGSFGSVQSMGESFTEALTFSAKTGADIFITSFTLMKDVVQITLSTSKKSPAKASQDFVLTASRSDFRTATISSRNGANLISDHANDYHVQYKGADVQTIQVPVDPIPLRVQSFTVGQEQKLIGHTLTIKKDSTQPTTGEGTSHDKKAFQLMVLNDIGKQLYGQ